MSFAPFFWVILLCLPVAGILLFRPCLRFQNRIRFQHFVSAVDTAIALRFESEMKARTGSLLALGEHQTDAPSETHNSVKIRQHIRSLEKFSNDLAELLQYQKGLKRLSPEEFSLDEAFSQAVRKFSQQNPGHKAEIILRLPDSATHVFFGCRETLQQLVVRLLEGVWFRGDRGDIILGVEVTSQRKNTEIVVAVSTATAPSTPNRPEELFLPFTAKGSARRGASDMELSLALHAAFLLNGNLKTKHLEHSSIGLVARFPLVQIPIQKMTSTQKQQLDAGDRPLSGKKILLVNTSMAGMSTLRDILERWGNSVDTFSTGREALHHIRSKQPSSSGAFYDYLFLDESTEDFEYAVVMHYVLSNPAAIRRVVLIARRSPKASQREPGVHGVLEKPFSRDSLATFLNSLENREPEAIPGRPFSTDTNHTSRVVPALDVRAESLLPQIPEPQPKQKLMGLVVDDNLVNMHTIAGVLRQRSMDVLVAENGKEALEIFLQNSQSLDFILMDVQMPEMDGCEATKRIRSFERERETRIPIIALTAYAKKEDRKRCLEAGMDDFISKGATPEALFEKINGLLTQKGPRTASASLETTGAN